MVGVEMVKPLGSVRLMVLMPTLAGARQLRCLRACGPSHIRARRAVRACARMGGTRGAEGWVIGVTGISSRFGR